MTHLHDTYQCDTMHLKLSIIQVNPLLHEFFFSSVYEIYPKIDSYRLPTHRRGVHKIFLLSLHILKLKCWSYIHIVTDMQ